MSRQALRARLDALDEDALVARIAARLGEDPCPGSRIAREYADGAMAEDDVDSDADTPDPDAFDPRLPEHAEGFAAFLAGKAFEEFQAALHRLALDTRIRADGRIDVWREMVVPEGWHLDGVRDRPLGTYWAFREDAAEAHWGGGEGDGTVRVVVHASVDPDAVDWEETAIANASEESTVGEEREIRLSDEAEVELVGIGIRHRHRAAVEPLDVSHLAGEMLAAGDRAMTAGLRAPR